MPFGMPFLMMFSISAARQRAQAAVVDERRRAAARAAVAVARRADFLEHGGTLRHLIGADWRLRRRRVRSTASTDERHDSNRKPSRRSHRYFFRPNAYTIVFRVVT